MNNIKKLRSKKGMTQTEFCAKCGLARTYISFLENGNKKISLDAAHRMSSVLECSIFELLGDDLFYVNPSNDEERLEVISFLVENLDNETLKEMFYDIIGKHSERLVYMYNDGYYVRENLKRIREEKNLKIDDLSNISNVSGVTIRNIENGKFNPHPGTIYKLAEALNCTFEELVREVN